MKCNIVLKFLFQFHVVGVLAAVTECHNILFFHAVATSSHRTAIWPLAEKLADKGHNLTYIFPIEKSKRVGSHPKIEEILPSKMLPLNKEFVADFDINIRLENRVEEWLQTVFSHATQVCEAFYDSPETIEWLSRSDLHYDLIIIDASFGECAFGLVHKFKAKHILFIPFVSGMLYDTFGIVPETSSIPDPFFNYKPNEMSLVDRVWNTVTPMLWRYNILQYINEIEPIIRGKINMTDMPSITEFERNTSFVFYNGHFVEEHPTPLPSMFVSYSGLRCDKTKRNVSLPKNIDVFIQDSEEFVYVSLGSAVDVAKMPASLRNAFFDAFKAFPNVKFLWRWPGAVPPNKPDNVMLASWFPQLDILSHPKIRAFVTQGGRPSIQEALCYNVPLITIPVFGDQDYNANRLELLGGAIRLDISKLTSQEISNAIGEMKLNPRYKETMTKLSNIFKDRPIDPLDNVLYWTEYAIRHDTSLLKPLGMNQTWYQRRLFDVYGFLLLLFSIIIALISLIVYGTFKLFYLLLNGNWFKPKQD